MNMVFRAVSILAALMWFNTAWVALSSKPLMFFNVPSLFFAIMVPLFLMVGLHGLDAVTFYWKKGDAKNKMIDLWSRMVIAAGVTGSIMGIVDMLSNMKDPKAIGPALAVALLTILYAFTAKLFLLEPFRDISDSNQSETTPNKQTPKTMRKRQRGLLIAATVVATLATQVIVIGSAIAVDEHILKPRRQAQWDQESLEQKKLWESQVEKINNQAGTSLTPEEMSHLKYLISEKELYGFETINKVYEDSSINHQGLFKILENELKPSGEDEE